jgi:hypothetical protein
MPVIAEERPPLLEASQRGVELPLWRTVEQRLVHRGLPSVRDAIAIQLARPEVRDRVTPGARVAVGVGSRGIGCLHEVVQALVAGLRSLGAEPFIVPAMGSHGGATAEGQQEVLASLGITEESVGAPIRAGMDTVELGKVLDGVPVHFDRIALTEADLVVPVARVKPHTDFRANIESGLHKMLAIGFGNHRGASTLHQTPFEEFGELIPAAGSLVRSVAPVPFGLAIVEDSYEDAAVVEIVLNEAMPAREAELLALAKQWLPRLPFDSVDVLVVQEMGKNISGAGMDPNVTGRTPLGTSFSFLRIGNLVVLDLTEQTHGNAVGIGVADITTRRAAEKIDWFKTYTNHVTARTLAGAKLPLVASTDREAFDLAVRTLPRVDPQRLRFVWIRNTLEVARMQLSEAAWQAVSSRGDLEALTEPEPVRFDAGGSLCFPS